MNTKTKNAILISFGVTILCAGGAYYYIANSSKPVPMVEVAMSTAEVKTGDVLSEEKYRYVQIPQSEYSPSYVTKVKTETKNDKGENIVTYVDTLKGKEVASDIYPNEKIMKGRVSNSAGLTDENGNVIDISNYRKMMFAVNSTQTLSGQVQPGDKVDFWVRYTLSDTKNKDKLVVVDKVLKNITINKAYDTNSNEITDGSVAAKNVELLLTEEELQTYIQYRDFGSITLVKVPKGTKADAETDIVRKKLSTNNLIWEVVSMKEDQVTADKITKDPSKESEISNYVLEENNGSIKK